MRFKSAINARLGVHTLAKRCGLFLISKGKALRGQEARRICVQRYAGSTAHALQNAPPSSMLVTHASSRPGQLSRSVLGTERLLNVIL